MSGEEAIICPFCGAPYSGTVPYDVVDLKCRYCGGRILLPSHLSVVPRCPNHPDTVAVGLCSQCSQRLCKECLHVKQFEGGRTYLCTRCLQAREVDNAWASIAIGALMIFFALVFLSTPVSYGAIIFLLFSLPFIVYGVYILKSSKESSVQTVQEIEEEAAREAENMLPADVESLYWRLWREYARTMGLGGPTILERRIHQYMSQGMSKEEAIRRLARNEKID
jgi:DNA-directed RNA polymerase subunit RPC12/RpoP